MTLKEAIQARHSVRHYTDAPIETSKIEALRAAIREANAARPRFSMVGYTHIDLGIAKYHFELAAGKENFRWKE